MYCSGCGQPIVAGQQVCTQCGRPVATVPIPGAMATESALRTLQRSSEVAPA